MLKAVKSFHHTPPDDFCCALTLADAVLMQHSDEASVKLPLS